MVEGTDLKLNVHIDPISGFTMDDIDFVCYFFTNSSLKKVVCKKEDMIRIDEHNYIALICSKQTGYGALKMMIAAMIPDIDFDILHNGKRQEVETVDTGIYIDKNKLWGA